MTGIAGTECVTATFGGCPKAAGGRNPYLIIRDGDFGAGLHCARTSRTIRLNLDLWEWIEIDGTDCRRGD